LEVRRLESGLYEVPSFRVPGRTYVVDVLEGSCTCPHFKFRGAHCKHLRLVEAKLDQTQYWRR